MKVQALIHQCPVCAHALHVTKLECNQCATIIENKFSLSKFAMLSEEQLHFIEIFLLSRGNIKEVEKALGISYPTVRAKLNDVITNLGYKEESEEIDDKKHIIAELETGEITVEEALERLKNKEEESK